MRRILLLGAALMLTSPLLVGQASAAGAAPLNAKLAATDGSIVEKAGYRCVRWTRKCAWRWGVGTRRYYRCLRRHGC
jgi:hypothetical protein